MPDLFADRLLDAIQEKRSPICVGIDSILAMFPPTIIDAKTFNANDTTAAVDAIFEFTTQVLKIVAPHAPCVKFQSAYFEQFYAEGIEAYYSLITEAKHLGLLVIGDVKRGDIGSTSEAYAQAHLADVMSNAEDMATPDAITVNPMLGIDTLDPFIQTARKFDKGLFVLVRTSNPGSTSLQDAPLATGATWCEHLAEQLQARIAAENDLGRQEFSSIGAVVGATQTHTMKSLRARLPNSIFLLPGYGAQGATAEMTKAAFVDGKGAIVSASRSILYAHRDAKYAVQFGGDWQRSVERAVIDMKSDLAPMLER